MQPDSEGSGYRLVAQSQEDAQRLLPLEHLLDSMDELAEKNATHDDKLSQVAEVMGGLLHAFLNKHSRLELFRNDEHLEAPQIEHEYKTLGKLLGTATPSPVTIELKKAFYPFGVSLAMLRDHLDMGNLQMARTKLTQIEAWSEQVFHTARSRAVPVDHEVVMIGPENSELNRLRKLLDSRDFELVVFSQQGEAIQYVRDSAKACTVILRVSKASENVESLIALRGGGNGLPNVRVFAIADSQQTPENLGIDPARLDGWFSRPLDPMSVVQAISV